MGPYGSGPHYRVSTPWATDMPDSDRVGGPSGVIEQHASPHQGLTCEKFGDQTFLRGSLETVDTQLLRDTILQHTEAERLYAAFQVFDPDHKGTITATQFRRTIDAVLSGLPGWAGSQMLLLGMGGSGLFSYQRMMRSVGFSNITGELPQPAVQAPSTARAAGTSGDIIAHRDESEYESSAATPVMIRGVGTTAQSSSGDIIGHTSPIRSADLAWDMKGRVVDGKVGTLLEYPNTGYNCVHETPKRYSAYRNAGDIIANTDFKMENERKMFQSKGARQTPGTSVENPLGKVQL